MSAPIQLSEAETASLERILSLNDLERQKRIAYPFWILAIVSFLAAQIALFWEPLVCVALLPLSFAAAMIGTGRYGYYKLFRLLHHQAYAIEQLRHRTPLADGNVESSPPE